MAGGSAHGLSDRQCQASASLMLPMAVLSNCSHSLNRAFVLCRKQECGARVRNHEPRICFSHRRACAMRRARGDRPRMSDVSQAEIRAYSQYLCL